jgi:hypothetical protein
MLGLELVAFAWGFLCFLVCGWVPCALWTFCSLFVPLTGGVIIWIFTGGGKTDLFEFINILFL